MYRITIRSFKYAYISSHVGHTYTILFTCIINSIQEKKTKHLYDPFSYHIHFHRYFWLCEYVYYPSNLIQPNNHKKITPTKICFISDVHYPNANNPEKLKEITNTLLKVKPNFYLLGGDFVDEFTSKEDMKILFKQLARLTKVAPVYFIYGNHKSKTKFTKNKLNHKITKNNIIILNNQEVHLNNIILIGRKDYTSKRLQPYKQNLQHCPRPSTTRDKRKH